MRYCQKKELISFVLYCFENPSIVHNFGTTSPIQRGFSAKCTFPNEHFNQIENWKCHMFAFILISLNRITLYIIFMHAWFNDCNTTFDTNNTTLNEFTIHPSYFYMNDINRRKIYIITTYKKCLAKISSSYSVMNTMI